MRWFILFFVCLLGSCRAELVPFFSNPAYTRDEPTNPPWFVLNSGQPSVLYYNGVYQSEEVGCDDLDLPLAWLIQPRGVKVGILDMTTHGARTLALVNTVSPGSVVYYIALSRWSARELAAGITDAVGSGCRVVVISTGFSGPDPGLFSACVDAQAHNVLLVCAVPNVEGDLESGLVDYPYSWSAQLYNILGVNCTDRAGNHYAPSAHGVHVIGAPGRNIVAAGTYSSGTSWSAPIAAGCASLVIARAPGQSVGFYRSLLEVTAVGPAKRIDVVMALRKARPKQPLRLPEAVSFYEK